MMLLSIGAEAADIFVIAFVLLVLHPQKKPQAHDYRSIFLKTLGLAVMVRCLHYDIPTV